MTREAKECMSDINDGGSAFPIVGMSQLIDGKYFEKIFCGGMSLRD